VVAIRVPITDVIATNEITAVDNRPRLLLCTLTQLARTAATAA
jgi:hypothetical protein